MQEVYWARYARDPQVALLGVERLDAPEAIDFHAAAQGVLALTGSAFAAFPQLAARCHMAEPLQCPPRARDIAALAALDGLDAAVPASQAAPVYLRESVASPPASAAL
jgi:tRNA A37 threonylcarbamoyladenosine modification protein TsaB